MSRFIPDCRSGAHRDSRGSRGRCNSRTVAGAWSRISVPANYTGAIAVIRWCGEQCTGFLDGECVGWNIMEGQKAYDVKKEMRIGGVCTNCGCIMQDSSTVQADSLHPGQIIEVSLQSARTTIMGCFMLNGALPLFSDRLLARMTAFPCILYQRLKVRLDGHFCAAHAVADVLRSNLSARPGAHFWLGYRLSACYPRSW